MLTKIISFFLENKFLTFLFLSLLIILGIQSFFNLKMDAFPDVTNIQVEIVATSPTLSPIEMEKFVTYPIENSLRGIPGLSTIRSTTKFGISVITAIFKDDVDIYFARQQFSREFHELWANCQNGLMLK
jgi:Putative silver efflux pump